MGEVKFVRPTPELIEEIADNMRDEDVAEVWASNRFSPMEALQRSVSASKTSVVVMIDGTPVAALGVVVNGILSGTGVPWLLSSKHALRYKRQFLTLTKPVIQEMLEMCPRLVNYVHTENKLSIRWLKWMGFIVEEPTRLRSTGALFHRFHMER